MMMCFNKEHHSALGKSIMLPKRIIENACHLICLLVPLSKWKLALYQMTYVSPPQAKHMEINSAFMPSSVRTWGRKLSFTLTFRRRFYYLLQEKITQSIAKRSGCNIFDLVFLAVSWEQFLIISKNCCIFDMWFMDMVRHDFCHS